MKIISASDVILSFDHLIDLLANSCESLMIMGEQANAILISEERWTAIQETLYLMAIPGMRESIKDAMAEPLAKSKRALKR